MTTPPNAAARAGADVEALFDGFFSGIASLRQDGPGAGSHDVNATIRHISSGLWAPRIERQESTDSLQVTAHFPGVPANQVRIDTATPGRLKIFGECSRQAVYGNGRDQIGERQLGQLEKDIPLPAGACVDRMTAIFGKESVVITIPKRHL
ncbi:hypothetical protein GGF46_000573 [Coemansia sp. RSA 552]|nr:hypothetical protein GGF46_000573 [Coemansia sp. RSA 552]